MSNQNKKQTQKQVCVNDLCQKRRKWGKWESMGKPKNHQKPMGINGKIVKMRYARKRGKWGKWESLGNGKIETPPKINGDEWGNTFKTPKKNLQQTPKKNVQ